MPQRPLTVLRLLEIAAIAITVLALALPSVNAASQPSSAAIARQPRVDGAQLLRLYPPDGPARLWAGNGQAQLALDLLRAAPSHGLDPSDYDVDRLSRRLRNPGPDDAGPADQALSLAMLQFYADLHFGRLAPDFQLPAPPPDLPRFDPVEHLRLALRQQRLSQAVEAAAPALPLYKRVRNTLQQYRDLAIQAPQWVPPALLPPGGKLVTGTSYPGLGRLRERLMLLGDLDGGAAATGAELHSEELAQAIKRFQLRHGLEETGHLARGTLAALDVPLGHRVRQLELTLERLRWMPPLRPGRIIVVNVPAYRLWAFDTAAGAVSDPLEMRVIVGKAARTPTPLFIGQMRYLEFNPYWNVPSSIASGEIAPKLARNPGYLTQNGMELVSRSGVVERHASPAAVAALRAGTVRVRQRPGSHNVLGAVKFAMPNPMNIYLHSTSAKELFGKVRRDLSHGCIRVERPAELARFVLAGQPQWGAQAIDAAMAPGRTRTVRLTEDIPVVLFYATAATDRSGRALFANDIYRRDDRLIRALQVH